jgi:hypothetical protein
MPLAVGILPLKKGEGRRKGCIRGGIIKQCFSLFELSPGLVALVLLLLMVTIVLNRRMIS